MVYVFILLRYIVFYRKGYDINETELVGQMIADIPTLLPVIGCLPITAVVLTFVPIKNNLYFGLVVYLWLLIVCSILYCVHSKKYILCEEVNIKQIGKIIIQGSVIFIVAMIGVLITKTSVRFGYVGAKIYLALIQILLIMLFINNLSIMAKKVQNK